MIEARTDRGDGVLCLFVLIAIGLALSTPASTSASDDWIDVGSAGREVWAVDGATGRRTTLRLDLNETIVSQDTLGGVAIVATTDRLLGISAGGAWSEVRLGSQEAMPPVVYVEERVGLVLTGRRLLGFSGGPGRWAEERMRPGEAVVDLALGDEVAVVVTGDRVLGLSGRRVGFDEDSLGPRERIETVGASDRSGTVMTERAIRTFSVVRGWSQDRRRD